jgi:hypothetical protein
LPPGWILTIALQSFPIARAVPVSTLMSIYRCTLRWGFQPYELYHKAVLKGRGLYPNFLVIARSTVKGVIARSSEKGVIARSTVKGVIARVTVKVIIARATANEVIACITDNHVIATATEDPVIAPATANELIA